MGNIATICLSCCKDSSNYEDLTPADLEERRQKQVEAAERRMRDQEQRGISNIESVRRQQQKAFERDRQLEEYSANVNDSALKWQVN